MWLDAAQSEGEGDLNSQLIDTHHHDDYGHDVDNPARARGEIGGRRIGQDAPAMEWRDLDVVSGDLGAIRTGRH
jgi:hypothetical protein